MISKLEAASVAIDAFEHPDNRPQSLVDLTDPDDVRTVAVFMAGVVKAATYDKCAMFDVEPTVVFAGMREAAKELNRGQN